MSKKDEINQVTIPPEIPAEETAEAAEAAEAVEAAAGEEASGAVPLPGEMTRKERRKAKKDEKKARKQAKKEAKRHNAKRTKAQNFWLGVICIFTSICILFSAITVVRTYRNLDGHDTGEQPGNAAETTTQSSAPAPAPGGNTNPTPAEPGSGQSGENGAPTQDTAAILAKYTEVMDKLKTDVASYTKREYQDLPKDKLEMGALASILQPVIAGMMTSEDKAEEQQRDDAAQIPVIKCAKGCMLTDVSAIKSASMTEEGGKTTIVITLNDEKNPEPAAEGATSSPSATGGIFNPMSKADIDEKVASISVVTVNQLDVTYTDCTATLVFDTETLQVESLTQIMNASIAADARAAIIHVNGTGLLINTMKIYNVKYK